MTQEEAHHYRLILEGLHARTGIDFSLYREGTLQRRMSRRIVVTGSAGYRTYFEYLLNNPQEYHLLLRDLTIKVSRFFRNRAVFEILQREIFPALVQGRSADKGGTLRIWCTGCASGEEVYSTAIALLEFLRSVGREAGGFRISLFGTDIDDEVLDRARCAEYDESSLRESPRNLVERYFTCIYSPATHTAAESSSRLRRYSRYRVIDAVKNLVHFSRHDVASPFQRSPAAGVVANYDLILCRNLLIYFTRERQERALKNLVDSLNSGGYLILGRSESIPESYESTLTPLDSIRKIYVKVPMPGSERFA